MHKIRKILCFVLAAAVIFGVCSGFSSVFAKSITGLKILTLPDKTVFTENEDWIYGLWNISETGSGIYSLPSSKISFTHNPCCGRYPDRGMIDMTGLSIEISYSDGTTSVMKYAETKNKSGILTANILASPKGGKEYFIGDNIIEVYLSEAPKYYDSYTISIVEAAPEEPIIKLSSETAVIDRTSGYITGLGAGLTREQLENEIFDYGSAEVTFTKVKKSFQFFGTGSTVTAEYPDGTSETFTIIIPGDIDGNGKLNFSDVGLVSMALENNDELDKYQKKAADVDGMRRITANDMSAIIIMIEG